MSKNLLIGTLGAIFSLSAIAGPSPDDYAVYDLEDSIPIYSSRLRPLLDLGIKVNTLDNYGLEANLCGRMNRPLANKIISRASDFLFGPPKGGSYYVVDHSPHSEIFDYNANLLLGETIGLGLKAEHTAFSLFRNFSAIASTDLLATHRFSTERNSGQQKIGLPTSANLMVGTRYEGEINQKFASCQFLAKAQGGVACADYGDASDGGLAYQLEGKANIDVPIGTTTSLSCNLGYTYDQIRNMNVQSSTVGLVFHKNGYFIGGADFGVEWKRQSVSGAGTMNRVSATVNVGIQ